MATQYIPAIIWVISAIICAVIAKRRDIKPRPSLFWELLVVILGPFAIPLMFLPKSHSASAKKLS